MTANRILEVATRPIPALDFDSLAPQQRAAFERPLRVSGVGVLLNCNVIDARTRRPYYTDATTLYDIGVDESPSIGWSLPEPPKRGSVLISTNYCQALEGAQECTELARDVMTLRLKAVRVHIRALQAEAEHEPTRAGTGRALWFALHTDRTDKWARLLDKIDEYTKLLGSWDGYGAPAPNAAAVKSTKLFLTELRPTGHRLPDRVKPSVVGGLGITFRSESRKAYIEFYNNGNVFAMFSDGMNDPKIEQIRPTARDFRALIKRVQDYLDAQPARSHVAKGSQG